MTLLIRKLNSQSLPYDSNKLQLPVKSQKVKKKKSNKFCFYCSTPSSWPETREGKRVKKGGEIL